MRGPVGIGEKDVEVAIGVDVRREQAATHFGGGAENGACYPAMRVEPAPAVVHHEQIRFGVESPEGVDGRLAAGWGGRIATALDPAVGHREVQIRVLVEVGQGDTETGVGDARKADTGQRRGVEEHARRIGEVERIGLAAQDGS